MKLGSTADGVEAPSRPEGVASAAAVPSGDAAPMDDLGGGANHTQMEGVWKGYLLPYIHLGRCALPA